MFSLDHPEMFHAGYEEDDAAARTAMENTFQDRYFLYYQREDWIAVKKKGKGSRVHWIPLPPDGIPDGFERATRTKKQLQGPVAVCHCVAVCFVSHSSSI
jgi:hypothetical protein